MTAFRKFVWLVVSPMILSAVGAGSPQKPRWKRQGGAQGSYPSLSRWRTAVNLVNFLYKGATWKASELWRTGLIALTIFAVPHHSSSIAQVCTEPNTTCLFATEVPDACGWDHEDQAQGHPNTSVCNDSGFPYAVQSVGYIGWNPDNDCNNFEGACSEDFECSCSGLEDCECFLEATQFNAYSLLAGRAIKSVRVDVQCRYNHQTAQCGPDRGRVRLRVELPSLSHFTLIDSEQFSNGLNDDDCKYRLGASADITEKPELSVGVWTAALVNDLVVKVRRLKDVPDDGYDSRDENTALRVNAFRIAITDCSDCDNDGVCDYCDGQPDGTPCETGNLCTIDTCVGGCCQPQSPLCPPGVICCADETRCNDNNACTNDSCVAGCCSYSFDCRGGTNCCPDDGNPCIHEFCNQATGACSVTPDCTSPADCDDGNVCFTYACVNSCCESTPRECPPRECHRVVGCDPVNGCQYTFDCREPGENCCPDDGNPCTHESCDADTGLCEGPPDCTVDADCEQDPPDLCIVDSCLEQCCTALTLCPPSSGACCANNPDICRDGLACTVDSCDAPGCCNQSSLCPPGVTCCADGASCDDFNACTNETCDNGCCAYTPRECPPRECHRVVGCDPIEGCQYEAICMLIPDFCDDRNVCTVDRCNPEVDGCCEYADIPCPERPCFTLVSCNPTSGCEYAPVECTDPVCTSCNPQTGACEDNSTCDQVTCRTPGFWATHACGETGLLVRNTCERKKDARNVTQKVITECGGCLEVCGDVITNTELNDSDSALEAMCVTGGGVRQLARHLTAAALNCCISGGGNTCQGIGIEFLFAECNAACAAGSTTGGVTGVNCVGAIDCFNNGGQYNAGTGFCQTGTCANGDACNDSAPCADLSPCSQLLSNCHDRNLGICSGGSICTEDHPCPVGEICGPTGSAGSSNACNSAKGNACHVIGTSLCATGGSNGPQSCP